MIKVAVKINGKEYSLVGKEDEKYLRDIANFVDSKINEVKSKNPLLSLVDSSILASVNIADDLYKVGSESERLHEQKGQLLKENQELNKKIRALSEENEVIKKAQEGKGNEYNAKIDLLKEQIDALSNEKSDLSRLVEKGNRINNTLIEENNRLKEELSKNKQLSDLLNKEIIKVKEESESLNKKLKQDEFDTSKLQKELDEIEKARDIAEMQLLQKNSEEQMLKNELERLKVELEEAKNKNFELEDLKNQLKEVQAKNSEYKNKIINIKTDGTGSSKELKTAKYKVLDLEKKLLDAQFEIAKLKKDKNPLRKF